MPKLGDFIGALLADVAQARIRADLETVRIAEAYSTNGLLKHLPVPRFRLPDLTVDVPVLVSALGSPGEETEGRLFIEPAASEVNEIVLEGLRAGDIHLEPGVPQKIGAVGSARMRELFASDSELLASPTSISKDVTSSVVESLSKVVADDSMRERLSIVETAIRNGLEKLLVSKMIRSPYLEVAVTASEIKSHADTESVVRLRLNISEDAYEVVSSGDDGELTLTPE
jgi:hypothetical protein